MSVTAKALWYVESHLNEELSLEAIADATQVSRFHLSHAFAVSAGISLGEYTRARRLSEAARSLAAGASNILDVAIHAGYGSHEAFTRAFRQHFGITPAQLRAPGQIDELKLQEPLRMTTSTQNMLTTPRREDGHAMLIFGIGGKYTAGGTAGIPAQWNKFVPWIGQLPEQKGDYAYGVICPPDETGAIEYVCGVEVRAFPAHPPEFARLRIPAQHYAVFQHRGHVSAIANTCQAIWEHGLTDFGYRAAEGSAFERYGKEFDGRTGLGGLEIWIPVGV